MLVFSNFTCSSPCHPLPHSVPSPHAPQPPQPPSEYPYGLFHAFRRYFRGVLITVSASFKPHYSQDSLSLSTCEHGFRILRDPNMWRYGFFLMRMSRKGIHFCEESLEYMTRGGFLNEMSPKLSYHFTDLFQITEIFALVQCLRQILLIYTSFVLLHF